MISVQSMLFPRVLQEPNTLLVPGTVYVSYLQQRAESTTNIHGTQNHISDGITYLVRYSSSYLLELLCTTNKTGGGRATEGERCMYTANTSAALPAVTDYIYILRATYQGNVYQF